MARVALSALKTAHGRRRAAAFAAVLALFGGGVSAAATEASRPLTELFPGLDRYLRTPEPKRTMFRMRYCVQSASGDESMLRVNYAAPEGDRSLQTDEHGCFAALPVLDDLKANPLASAQADGVFKIIVALEPTTPLKRVIAMADLRAAIQQADDAARAAAGPFAWGAPHLDSVHFDLESAPTAGEDQTAALQTIGLDAAPVGYAIFLDGSRRPLPVRDGRVMAAPEDPAIRNAPWIELAGDPLNARIGFSTPIKR